MANSYLTKTSGTPTSQKTGTFSFWVKRSGLGSTRLFNNHVTSVYYGYIDFTGGDQLRIAGDDAGTIDVKTNRVFRDTSAWYHIVIAIDSTQSTAADRVKVYVNGVQETSFATSTYQSQNDNLNFLSTSAANGHVVGAYYNGSAYSGHFNGYMSHVAFVDGTALTPTSFGETDSTSGIWKFKSPSGITWGNNGFHLKFENSGNLGLDSSGQTNNFTTNGDLKQALDTPSNVYATLNALQRIDDYNFSNGNNTFTNTSAGAHRCVHSTLAASSGKWYAEVKVIEVGGTYPQIGVINPDVITFTDYLGGSNKGYGYLSDGRKQINTSATSYGNTYTTGDIIGIAMDLDNHKLYFSKNGTFQNSGVPTSGSTGTGAIDLATGVFYSFGQSSYKDSSNPVYSWNFGNGFFGTTAITSAGSNGNGSLFEYDCPTGYYALNTKNINTYG